MLDDGCLPHRERLRVWVGPIGRCPGPYITSYGLWIAHRLVGGDNVKESMELAIDTFLACFPWLDLLISVHQ